MTARALVGLHCNDTIVKKI